MSCVGTRVKYIGNVYGMFYKEGVIVKENGDIVQVKFDIGMILYLYKKYVVIIKSEDNNMAKLEGYYAVAVTEEGTGYNKRNYYYAIFDDGFKYDKYDNVLVSGASHNVLMIKDIITPEEAREEFKKDITAEVICKVDFDRYNKRVEERKEKAERKKEADKIKKQMDKMITEMDQTKRYEMYANDNPELAEKLKAYKELIGE